MNLEDTGNVTIATSTGSSLVLAINNYATVISLSLTAIGVIAGIVFHLLALRDRRRHTEAMIKGRRKENEPVKIERRKVQ